MINHGIVPDSDSPSVRNLTLPDFSDAQIIAAVDSGNAGPGGRVAHILRRLGVNFAKPDRRLRRLYQRLCKLEAIGKVHRDPRRSYINSIYWQSGPKVDAATTQHENAK